LASKKILFLLLFVLTLSNLHAQTTTFFEEWVESGGNSPTQVQNELLERIVTVTDGSSNLFVASSTFNDSTDVHDLLLQKFNSGGTLIWSNQFNISGGGEILVGDMVLDGSGNPIVTGAVLKDTNSYDALTVKYTALGAVSWSKTWNGNANGYDGCTSVTTDGSGNIYVCGMATTTSTSRDFLAIKYTSGGTQSWVALYDNSSLTDIGVKVTEDSGVLRVFGAAQTNGTTWVIVAVRYYTSSGTQFAANVLSSSIVFNEVNSYTTDANDNTYVVGTLNNGGNGYDFLTIKVDADMAVVWSATWDGSGDKDVAKAVAVDASGNVFVTGYTTTTSNGRNFMTLKYNSSGSGCGFNLM
jgi:hypothetical protein